MKVLIVNVFLLEEPVKYHLINNDLWTNYILDCETFGNMKTLSSFKFFKPHILFFLEGTGMKANH